VNSEVLLVLFYNIDACRNMYKLFVKCYGTEVPAHFLGLYNQSFFASCFCVSFEVESDKSRSLFSFRNFLQKEFNCSEHLQKKGMFLLLKIIRLHRHIYFRFACRNMHFVTLIQNMLYLFLCLEFFFKIFRDRLVTQKLLPSTL
jgi:hypothetical protein